MTEYQENFANFVDESEEYFSQAKFIDPIVHFIMTQYSTGMGLQKFNEQVVVEVTKQLKQTHDLQMFIPMDANAVTEEDKQKAIPLLMFFTEKQFSTAKARECANVSKQREFTKKEDAASPTICLDSIFITGVIDAI